MGIRYLGLSLLLLGCRCTLYPPARDIGFPLTRKGGQAESAKGQQGTCHPGALSLL